VELLKDNLEETEKSLEELIKKFEELKKESIEINDHITIIMLADIQIIATMGIFRKYLIKALLRLLEKGDFNEVYRLIKEMTELHSKLKLE